MKRALPVLVAGCGLLLAAGCGSSSKSNSSSTPAPASAPSAPAAATPAPSGGVVPVAYRNIQISPKAVTVHVGETVKWTNFDGAPHNVTSQGGPDKIASKDFLRGETFSFKADKVGTIRYLCTIHPASMVGTITVVQ